LCLYSASMVSFICPCAFLGFLECLLYILADHIQYHLYKILIDSLQDFFFQIVLVGFIGFFGIVYLRFVGVWVWVSVFFWGETGFPLFPIFPSLPLLLLLSLYFVQFSIV
jgi:hypothetical protein